MTSAVRLLPAADADIDQAALYIARDSIEHALRFYDSIDATLRLLSEHSERGSPQHFDHPRLQGIRRCIVIGFRNHLIFYRIEAEVIEIIRVLHGARDIPAILTDEPIQEEE